MKIWIKLLAGSILGLVLGFLLPAENETISRVFNFLGELAIGMGRYTAAAMLLFSLTIAIYELRQDGIFWTLVTRTMAVIIVVSIFTIGIGVAVATFFPPERIPILTEQNPEQLSLETGRYFLEMFPSNMLSVVSGNGIYLFPVCIFAFFMAIGLSYDKTYTKTVISLVDSLSRIFYHIGTFFSEILGLLIIVLSAYWALRYQAVQKAEVFHAIVRLLLVFSLVLAALVLPLFLFFVKRYKTPWKIVYASLGSSFAAFFSGDINFSLPVFMQQTKENLGIRRRANMVITMLWTSFGRSGSAMIAAISLLVIIKSYSSLDLEASALVGIVLQTLLISFLLSRNPGNGAFAALSVLCASYGHGLEAGYLILKPMAFYLVSIGAFLDMVIASLGSFAVARLSGFQVERELKHFV
ncbi:MAG: dicarboxylate/amino acid:cation symporter [Spirochaetaceae bacterium]|jgi:Na+/H+-dicarboxylate symporter|nr:dicarboxylate/amino acid:cation symporter [Spirochaetaceae bacterium]